MMPRIFSATGRSKLGDSNLHSLAGKRRCLAEDNSTRGLIGLNDNDPLLATLSPSAMFIKQIDNNPAMKAVGNLN
jgi:hypothetical protein